VSAKNPLNEKGTAAVANYKKVRPAVANHKLDVEVRDRNIVVTSTGFEAVYYRRTDQPYLILRHRTKTDDFELLAQVYQAAVAKARELGWIV
jgi:hypothetical protein